MPLFLENPISRKNFLRLGTAFVAGMCIERIGTAAAWSRASNSEPSHRFAMLSDTHIAFDPKDTYRGFFPSRNLATVVQQVLDTPYDMALLSGDAARLEGKADDYQQLQTLLKPLEKHCPVTLALGNHDDRKAFRDVFAPKSTPEIEAANRHVTVIDSPHARWLVLDSLLYVNQVAGLLGKAQRQWLKDFVEGHQDKPILIVVHHTLGDNDGELLDAPFLLDLARRSRHVQAIFYGHSHRFEFLRDQHVHLINLPAIGYNFDDAQPVGWCSVTLQPQGLSLQLHAIAGNQAKNGEVTELQWGKA